MINWWPHLVSAGALEDMELELVVQMGPEQVSKAGLVLVGLGESEQRPQVMNK